MNTESPNLKCPLCDVNLEFQAVFTNYLRCPTCAIQINRNSSIVGTVTNTSPRTGRQSLVATMQWRLVKRWVGTRKLIDVGCGIGDFLQVAQEELGSERCAGIEVDEVSLSFAKMRGLRVSDTFNSNSDQLGTLYTFWHSAEHINTREMIETLRKISSRESGSKNLVLVCVPNSDSLAALLTGEKWSFHDPSHHLVQHNEQSLRVLFHVAGLRVIAVEKMWLYGLFDAFQSTLNLSGEKNLLHSILKRGQGEMSLSLVLLSAIALVRNIATTTRILAAEFTGRKTSCVVMIGSF